MEEYQERVIKEREEVKAKLDKLSKFIKKFKASSNITVLSNEYIRLVRQEAIMQLYVIVLDERIENF